MPGTPASPTSNGNSRRVILCIDDEGKLLMVRQMVLSAAGYTVLTAASGRAGLELFRRQAIDLVITDQLLPDISGTQVALEMKRIKPEVPIILLTGLPDAPEGAEHADAVLTKGLPVPDFLRSVSQIATAHQPV